MRILQDSKVDLSYPAAAVDVTDETSKTRKESVEPEIREQDERWRQNYVPFED